MNVLIGHQNSKFIRHQWKSPRRHVSWGPAAEQADQESADEAEVLYATSWGVTEFDSVLPECICMYVFIFFHYKLNNFSLKCLADIHPSLGSICMGSGLLWLRAANIFSSFLA